jgi:Cysteine-rich secretory protein family
MRSFVRKFFLISAVLAIAIAMAQPQYGAPAQDNGAPDQRSAVEQIFALANHARAQAGVGQLQWDPALADAALKHCRRMAQEGQIAHRYGGEPDVSGRAAQAGAHFSVIEENVAVGPSADMIHQEWMQSPGHRQNLLSPDVDRVGIAVVAARGVLYAVADYSRAVQQLSQTQVEARVAALIRPSGVAILRDPAMARRACTTDEGVPHSARGATPLFVMRWQDADLSQLPRALVDRLASGRYRQAAVGSCPAQIDEGSFSAYRIAVLLY